MLIIDRSNKMMYKSRIAQTSCMSFRKLGVALGLKLKNISAPIPCLWTRSFRNRPYEFLPAYFISFILHISHCSTRGPNFKHTQKTAPFRLLFDSHLTWTVWESGHWWASQYMFHMAQGALQVGITSVRFSEKLAEISEISGPAMITLSSRASVGIGSRIIGKCYSYFA